MTRKIKFRAWDKYTSKMLEQLGGISGSNSYISFLDFYYDNSEDRNFGSVINDLILMQFTGLLDKNGKEIFEGDLLQYDGYNFKLINKEKIYQIKYDDNLAQYYSCNLENSFDTFLVVRAWKESKIIGNIYENPELVEKINKEID
jgi:uncharacterized phage protein (TIGR01671 family)